MKGPDDESKATPSDKHREQVADTLFQTKGLTGRKLRRATDRILRREAKAKTSDRARTRG